MPIFCYECPKCNISMERLLRSSEDKDSQECSACSSILKRVPARSSFHLKDGGVGWARNGYSKSQK